MFDDPIKPWPATSKPCLFKSRRPYFDYGNNPAGAQEGGLKKAFDFPGFVPAYIRGLFCEEKVLFDGSLFRRPEDIYTTDQALELFQNPNACSLAPMAQEFISRLLLESAGLWGVKTACAPTSWFKQQGQGSNRDWRDHLDCGSVASPSRDEA